GTYAAVGPWVRARRRPPYVAHAASISARAREKASRSTWNIDPAAPDGRPGLSRSAPAAAVPPDRLLDVVAVLDQISLHLLVGQPQVAEDSLVERLRLGQVVAPAAAEERLEHRRSQERIAARLPRAPRRAHAGRGVTASV